MVKNTMELSLEKLYKKDTKVLENIQSGYIRGQDQNLGKIVLGCQGVPGAFSEEALVKYFKGAEYETIYSDTFESVLVNLQEGKIKYGVLPIENSSAGSIVEVYDLIRKYNCYIVGEQSLAVNHNLLGVPGARIEDIEEVYSHPQGFAQSSDFLSGYKDWKQIPYYNTAISAKYVKECGDKNKAAIASLRAAEIYNLDPIEKDINFNTNNHTRFIVVSNNMEYTYSSNKLSLVFSVAHTSGSLYHALAHFYYNGLNLLKIESRPLHNKSWEYFFFVDLEGNLRDANILIALGRILDQSTYFGILGNYKADI